VNGKSQPIASNAHAVSFDSSSGNRLCVPKEPHVTLASFVQNALPEERKSFWTLDSETYNELASGGHTLTVATHMGSCSGQSVPHFHLRFELSPNQKEDTQVKPASSSQDQDSGQKKRNPLCFTKPLQDLKTGFGKFVKKGKKVGKSSS
jgi:diadenosine tetraphosphate (Ap4A) HIT family hydrolase